MKGFLSIAIVCMSVVFSCQPTEIHDISTDLLDLKLEQLNFSIEYVESGTQELEKLTLLENLKSPKGGFYFLSEDEAKTILRFRSLDSYLENSDEFERSSYVSDGTQCPIVVDELIFNESKYSAIELFGVLCRLLQHEKCIDLIGLKQVFVCHDKDTVYIVTNWCGSSDSLGELHSLFFDGITPVEQFCDLNNLK